MHRKTADDACQATVKGLAATLTLALALLISAQAQEAPRGADAVRARYTKYEYRIPMRDGVKLFTAVYVPKDAAPDKTYPILLSRTPYSVGPYGVDHYPRQSRTVRSRDEGRLHLRQPGRPRTLHVRRHVRRPASAHPEEGDAARPSTKAPTPTTRSTGS